MKGKNKFLVFLLFSLLGNVFFSGVLVSTIWDYPERWKHVGEGINPDNMFQQLGHWSIFCPTEKVYACRWLEKNVFGYHELEYRLDCDSGEYTYKVSFNFNISAYGNFGNISLKEYTGKRK